MQQFRDHLLKLSLFIYFIFLFFETISSSKNSHFGADDYCAVCASLLRVLRFYNQDLLSVFYKAMPLKEKALVFSQLLCVSAFG